MFEDVKAKKVFEFFRRISDIPRGSGNEAGIADYLEGFANDRGLFCIRDKANNVFIRKNASSKEKEDHPTVIFQGHTDMVCEADAGVCHDFLKDPIEFIRNGDILTANGTTLGADDGVAVAVMLALLDSDDVDHPEIECLFTVGEEVGMDGMYAFDTAEMKSRVMINLDSAGEGIATVACAGGVRIDFSASPEKVKAPDNVKFRTLKVSGLYGGHSGEDINLGRTNAIETAVRILSFISDGKDIYVSGFSAGDKDNAIPREATVTFAVSYDFEDRFEKAVNLTRHELIKDDEGFTAELSDAPVSEVFTAEDSLKLIEFLSMLKSGPVMMSRTIENMVETSYNLSVVRVSDKIKVTVSARSSVEEALDAVQYKMKYLADLSRYGIVFRSRYPGWSFDGSSKILDVYKEAYKKLFGREAIAIGIHAGLECGLLKSRVPDMDIISIGPEIKDLHSPSETLSVSSLDRLWDIVVTMLEEL